jgi:purine-binding chemotaxis protein CheW
MTTAPQLRQFCTFYVADLFLGIDVQQVQEVFRNQAMTRVPLASAAIGGLINLRGQIVTAIEMRARLGLPMHAGGTAPMNVVLRDGESVVSLLVDRIGDVLEVGEDMSERPPTTLPENMRRLIATTYKLPNRLLLILDTEQVLAELDHRDLAEMSCVA